MNNRDFTKMHLAYWDEVERRRGNAPPGTYKYERAFDPFLTKADFCASMSSTGITYGSPMWKRSALGQLLDGFTTSGSTGR